MKPKKVLFLCTGNYYRSRFAEMLFNHLAGEQNLAWVADSRGLDMKNAGGNIGPVSPLTVRGLVARGVAMPARHRLPALVCEADFRDCDLVIALKEAEHRPMLEAAYPDVAKRAEYWHVHDLDGTMPDEAMEQIARQVRGLLARAVDQLSS